MDSVFSVKGLFLIQVRFFVIHRQWPKKRYEKFICNERNRRRKKREIEEVKRNLEPVDKILFDLEAYAGLRQDCYFFGLKLYSLVRALLLYKVYDTSFYTPLVKRQTIETMA